MTKQQENAKPLSPSQPWEQLYRGIRALRIAVDDDSIVTTMLSFADAARAADAETIRQQAQRIEQLEAALARPKGGQ